MIRYFLFLITVAALLAGLLTLFWSQIQRWVRKLATKFLISEKTKETYTAKEIKEMWRNTKNEKVPK